MEKEKNISDSYLQAQFLRMNHAKDLLKYMTHNKKKKTVSLIRIHIHKKITSHELHDKILPKPSQQLFAHFST